MATKELEDLMATKELERDGVMRKCAFVAFLAAVTLILSTARFAFLRKGYTRSWDEAIPSLAYESRRFTFGSGVGAWSSDVDLHRDGTFEGIYHDTDVGTVYICRFKGEFSKLKKIDDCTYAAYLKRIEQEGQEGEAHYKGGLRYITAFPYGFEHARMFLLYCPGASVEDMDEGMAFPFSFMELPEGNKIPADNYGLYNVSAGHGFTG